VNRADKAAVVVFLIGSAIVLALALRKREEQPMSRTAREKVLDEMGLDVAAIHRATDIINAKIERGEIRDYDELRLAVTTEVAFQKVAIREDFNSSEA
jgi:uncharacterized membrane protein